MSNHGYTAADIDRLDRHLAQQIAWGDGVVAEMERLRGSGRFLDVPGDELSLEFTR